MLWHHIWQQALCVLLFSEINAFIFHAVVLCAPMLDIDSGNVPSFLAKMIAHVASKTKYAEMTVYKTKKTLGNLFAWRFLVVIVKCKICVIFNSDMPISTLQ